MLTHQRLLLLLASRSGCCFFRPLIAGIWGIMDAL